MPDQTHDTLTRLRAANPAPVRPDHGRDPVARAALERIIADPAPPRSWRRGRGPRRLVLVLAVLVLGAGGAVAATDPLGWFSSNPGEARYGANPMLHVRTPTAQEIRCRPSATSGSFSCTEQHERCGQSSIGRFRCVLSGSGLAYDKFDAIQAPVGSSFSRGTLLAYIAHARGTGAMSATAAATFRADLARVPDSFFTEYRLASRYGTYGYGSSNRHGQNLVPPPGQPNILVCQNAGPGLSCRDLNGDLNAPIGAGVYGARPGPGWRVAPPQTQSGGLPPRIHFTRAEYQVLIDMLRYATVGHASRSGRG